MIIGITGGTGSGKSTLLHELKKLGALVLDCDKIYHELLSSSAELTNAIENRFPGTVVNGVLQRKKLGAIVFADEAALADLNRITHTAVKAEVLCRLGNAPFAAIDAIGLFEGGLAELCDVTVAVTAPLENRIRRLMAREGIGEEYAQSRIAAQHSDDWFRQKCHHVLVNDGDLETFQAKCLAFFKELGIMEEHK